MRLRIPDLSGLKERLRAGRVSKSGKGFPFAPFRWVSRFLKPAPLVAALSGLLLALLICVAAESFLIGVSSQAQSDLAKIVGTRPASLVIAQSQRTQNREVAFTPFNATEQSSVVPDAEEGENQTIDAFTLVGTLPRIGAWLSAEGEMTLVLRNQDYNGYTLQAIERGEVRLTKGEDIFSLYLYLGGVAQPKPPAASAPRSNTPPQAQAPDADEGVVKASEGRPGSVKKEVIDRLLLNPMEELRKIRLEPSGDGMRLLQAANDSLFAQLGMQAGDTIVGVNGVSFKDMAGAANAMSSLLTSNQFNLSLLRDSKPMQLDYSVR